MRTPRRTHTTQHDRADRSDDFTKSFMRFEAPYVMTGGELARGLLLAFGLGFGIATLCFLLFHQ